MPTIAKTAFEVKNSNIRFNDLQNVPGYFGEVSGNDYTYADCPAGYLCVSNGLAENEGYETFDIINGETHNFVVAANGNPVAGKTGDKTGIYVCNTHDVQRVKDAQGNVYNVGKNTLGLPLPAGERCTFTELVVGEKYKWGEGNFKTLPASGQNYATIDGGQWKGASSAPTGGGIYAEIIPAAAGQSAFEKGTRKAFNGYWLKICRAALS